MTDAPRPSATHTYHRTQARRRISVGNRREHGHAGFPRNARKPASGLPRQHHLPRIKRTMLYLASWWNALAIRDEGKQKPPDLNYDSSGSSWLHSRWLGRWPSTGYPANLEL